MIHAVVNVQQICNHQLAVQHLDMFGMTEHVVKDVPPLKHVKCQRNSMTKPVPVNAPRYLRKLSQDSNGTRIDVRLYATYHHHAVDVQLVKYTI